MVTQDNFQEWSWRVMLVLALLVGFSFQGSRGLYETTEGRYVEVAREMLETGNWMEPTLGYRPHWTKPPLTYWAIASGIKLLGANEWGARLYNAVAFVLTVVAVACLGTTLWDRTTGLVAGLIYASSPFPALGAYAVTTDGLLTLWETLAVLCYIRAWKHPPSPQQRTWVLVMWICFGLGFLTKAHAVFPILFFIFVWQIYQIRKVKLANPLGIMLFLLIGFSWFVMVGLRHPGFLSYYLMQEVVARVVTDTFYRHAEWYAPFTRYMFPLGVGAGPWLYFGATTVHREGLYNPKRLWDHLRRGGETSLLLSWLFWPLVLFSLARSRLELYVLPLYVPIALAMARALCKNDDIARHVRMVTRIALATGCVLVVAKGLATYIPNKRDMKALYEMCRAMDGRETRFLAFEEPQLFGLQFYLHGHLRRVSISGKAEWADQSLEESFGEMRRSRSPGSYVFISRRHKAPILHQTLERQGLRCKGLEGRYWVLCSPRELRPLQ